MHRDSGALRFKAWTNANDFNTTNQKFKEWFDQTENEDYIVDQDGNLIENSVKK